MTPRQKYLFLPLACIGAVLPAGSALLFVTTHRYFLLLGMLALPLTALARKIDRELLQAETKRGGRPSEENTVTGHDDA